MMSELVNLLNYSNFGPPPPLCPRLSPLSAEVNKSFPGPSLAWWIITREGTMNNTEIRSAERGRHSLLLREWRGILFLDVMSQLSQINNMILNVSKPLLWPWLAHKKCGKSTDPDPNNLRGKYFVIWPRVPSTIPVLFFNNNNHPSRPPPPHQFSVVVSESDYLKSWPFPLQMQFKLWTCCT